MSKKSNAEKRTRRVYAILSSTPLEIKGTVRRKGIFPVGGIEGAPMWVAAVFDEFPDIEAIAVNSVQGGGTIYSRIKDAYTNLEFL